jgi:ribosomal-protein-alanine N-acetyltransferase
MTDASVAASIRIDTARFLLRSIAERDITDRYLDWLSDHDAKRFITAAKETRKLADLRQYVLERVRRNDVLFLGIFEKNSGLHIGNIKYEPVDSVQGYAVMGVLIGDPAYRGKGVTIEVLNASAQWLKMHRSIKQIVLGVGKVNFAAVRSYEKAGFVIAETPYIQNNTPENMTMVWNL